MLGVGFLAMLDGRCYTSMLDAAVHVRLHHELNQINGTNIFPTSPKVAQGALPFAVPFASPTADCRRFEGSLFSCITKLATDECIKGERSVQMIDISASYEAYPENHVRRVLRRRPCACYSRRTVALCS